jgi:hypothetical protein
MSIKLMTIVWDMAELNPGAKLVLLALADQANDQGTHCYPSVETICRRSGQKERTVRRILTDLETAGHITRQHRSGTSTQYRVHPGGHGNPNPCQNGTPAKMAPLPKRQVTPAKSAPNPCQIGTQTINEPSSNPSPPTPRRGEERVRGALMPKDWKPVPIGELPPEIGALAAQWPKGAYEAEGAAFAQHWRGRGARRADWNALWAARVQARHAAVTRDAKAGVIFGGTAGAEAAPSEPVAAQKREDERSAELRAMLEASIDSADYATWFGPVALVFEDCGLVVVTRSSFWAAEIEKRHRRDIEDALSGLGRGVDWMRFVSERTVVHGRPVGKQAGKAGRRG